MKFDSPWAAPQRCSASAAAFTSVSKATGMSSRSLSAPTTLVLLQPGFAVSVIQPNVSDPARTSTGPKEPTPRAATRTLSRVKNSTTQPSVSGGVVVGMTSTSVRLAGPVPLAQTHFVPPASTPPNTAGSDAARAQSGSRGSVSVLIASGGPSWVEGSEATA